jgi:hypothetical protein
MERRQTSGHLRQGIAADFGVTAPMLFVLNKCAIHAIARRKLDSEFKIHELLVTTYRIPFQIFFVPTSLPCPSIPCPATRVISIPPTSVSVRAWLLQVIDFSTR